MKRWPRPKPTLEVQAPQQPIDPLDQSALELLKAARNSVRQEIEHTARQEFKQMNALHEADSLEGCVITSMRELLRLRQSVRGKENAYYYSRKGRRAAEALLAAEITRLNPGMEQPHALYYAKNHLRDYKLLDDQELGRPAIARLPAMPEVGKVEDELIGNTSRIEQSWKIEPAELGPATVVYILHDRLQPTLTTSTELFKVEHAKRPGNNTVTTAEGGFVSEDDHYFILGVISQTHSIFAARLAAKVPPLCDFSKLPPPDLDW